MCSECKKELARERGRVKRAREKDPGYWTASAVRERRLARETANAQQIEDDRREAAERAAAQRNIERVRTGGMKGEPRMSYATSDTWSECWCQRRIVLVTTEQVRAGKTATCGKQACTEERATMALRLAQRKQGREMRGNGGR